MKRTAKKIAVTLFTGLITFAAYSQTDSVKVEYSQEKVTTTNKREEAICDILTKRENKGKSLWKFNLLRTLLDGFSISYERKIAPNWSFDVSSATSMSGLDIYNTHYISSGIDTEFDFKEDVSFELRYYHNLKRRTRLAKKAGFSGNYFGLGMNSMYKYIYRRIYDSPQVTGYGVPITFHEYIDFRFSNSLTLIYGIQRKIGKVGYIDVSAGFGIIYLTGSNIFWGDKNYTFEINLPLKFGIGIAF